MAITSMYLIKRRNKIILRTMEGKKSKDETLLDWIQNPITKVQREQNKANWLLAQNVVHLRKAEALKRDEGLDYATNCKAPFLPFYDKIIARREFKSSAYQDQAIYAKKSFEAYLKYSRRDNIICREVDNDFAEDYQMFLINRYRTTTGRKLKHNTLHKYWSVFKKVVKKAMSMRYIMYNPLEDVPPLKVSDVTHKEALTIEEIKVLFNTPSDDIFKEDKKAGYIPTREFFMTCCFIGISIAEAQRLKWSDFRVTNENGIEKWSFFYKRVKTKKEHGYRPVPTQCIKRLKQLKERFNSEYVFPNFNLKQNNREYEKLRKWVKRAGIDKHITPHCVRSTFISLLANYAGESSLDMIAHFVGHTDKKVTRMYLTTEDKTARRLVEKIPNWEDTSPLQAV